MATSLTRDGAARRAAGTSSAAANALRSLYELAYVVLGPADPNETKRYIIQRAAIAGVILAVLPAQGLSIPGWQAVIGGCVFALIYNAYLGYLAYARAEYFKARALGLLLDSLVLLGASFFVFREMGDAGSSSDIWLVFLVYIVTGGFTLAPLGSLLYTALWTGWFALATLLFFGSDTQFYAQLPIRLIFFGTIGVVALGMASELQKRRVRLEQQNRQTMGMLAKLVEARDTDAGAHLHRIQHFSRALALHLGYSEREAHEVAYASMIHDVGKANVPDAVLKKSGPLSPEEWRLMQDHTAWGDKLLTENSDFEVARQVARWHHEHWDGSGYPDCLEGEDIPLVARIVAVADVFDALISARPYKDAWPAEAAMREIERMGGSHLDPCIVEAFVELWDTGVVQRISEEIAKDEAGTAEALERAA